MSAVLDAVRDAAERRQDAESDFRRLLVEARAEGHSLATIGRACGLTKQGARYIIQREKRRQDPEQEKVRYDGPERYCPACGAARGFNHTSRCTTTNRREESTS